MVLDPLELKLQMVLNSHVCGGTKLRLPGKTVSACNHLAIFPALRICIFVRRNQNEAILNNTFI